MANVIRIWKDEFDRLPDYSRSNPTGVCDFKTWKRGHPDYPDSWIICQYQPLYSDPTCVRVMVFDIVFLQGPRRGNERLRFKIECTTKEIRSWR